jgi:hypothetical protein
MAIGRIFAKGRVGWFSAELGVDAALPSEHHEADGSGFTMTRFAATTAACGHVDPVAACVSATVGRIAAQGSGVDQPASPGGTFSQLGLRIAGTHDLGRRFFAAARVEGLVMLAPWTVTLDGTDVWTTPRVGGSLGLDLGIHFF